MSHNNTAHINGLVAISPIAVFLLFYLAVSLIVGDFYKMPIAVALMVASAWAVVIMRGTPLSKRVEIFSRDAGSSNVMYMIWIFLLAGAFASLAKEIGAVEATVNLALKYLPAEMIIPGLFFAACFISLSIGTSVGTVVALAPLTVELAQSESGSIPFFVATVLSGAFFGDNLSFISDTTIAATRTQGCKMNDKFKANLWIALPAAIATLVLYIFIGARVSHAELIADTNPWLIIPYIVIIATALMGINVTVVLSLGIVTAITMGLLSGFGGQSGDNHAACRRNARTYKGCGRHQLHTVAAHRPHQRTARRAGFDSHAREPREHVYGQQHRSHHNSGLAVEVDIATIRHRPAQKRIAARHMLMHRAEPYTLRGTDPARHGTCGNITRGAVALHVLLVDAYRDGSAVDSVQISASPQQEAVACQSLRAGRS